MIEEIKSTIRDIPDFPKPGIIFKDITPVLAQPDQCNYIINEMAKRLAHENLDAIAGIESRGFLFGMSLAQALRTSFIPIRKKGKLPHETVSTSYQLEYGNAEIEMHKDALIPGMNIHIHDDLLATGGTAEAVSQMIKQEGASVISYSFLIELQELRGRDKLQPYSNIIESLIVY